MDGFLQDFKHGIRMLLKQRGFTIVALLTLSIGVGANTVIFSVVNAVLIRPLPYHEPDRLVSLWETFPEKGVSRSRIAPGTFLDWRSRSQSFVQMAAFSASSRTLTGAGEPEQVSGARVTDAYFDTLGVQPMLGRVFMPEEYKAGRDRVVILDHGLWQRKFGGDSRIIGTRISLDGSLCEVVGVMPPGLYPAWPETVARLHFDSSLQQYFTPMTIEGRWAENRQSHVYGVIGRLKPGTTIEQAQTEMATIGATLAGEYVANRGEGILVTRLKDEMVGEVRPAMLILFGAVGLVLLLACANVAGLLLAGINSRRREIAVRCALGAGRARIVRQFLTEGLVLALVGGVMGVWLASFGLIALMRIIPIDIPRVDQVSIDATALAFTLLLTILASATVSLAPAVQASKPYLLDALKDGGRSVSARDTLRRALVVAQIAISVILVLGATLLMQSFQRLRRVDLGFDPDRLLVASLTLPQSKYGEWKRAAGFYDQLLGSMKGVTGVKAAAVAYDHPLETNWVDSFEIEGRPAFERTPSADLHIVSPDYFGAVGAPLVAGRAFSDQDDWEHPGAVIINQALGATYFPGEQPLGKRLALATPSRMVPGMPSSFEIVGIVGDVKSRGIAAAAQPAYYIPARQFPQSDMQVIVRCDGDALAMASALKLQVRLLDQDQPIRNITTMEKLVSNAVAGPRFNTAVMGTFAAIALLLASIGIYGLLAHSVSARTQEIGIRMALGAKRRDVLRLVIMQGLRLAVAGTSAGLLAALAATRLMRKLLFEVSPDDPISFAAVAGALVLAAIMACYLPARRAARVDPMVALRHE